MLTRAHINWRHTCEQAYHVKRYLRLILIFIAFNFVSYCLFSRSGCEQAARARATALTVLHLAFSLWGSLTWRQIDGMCASAAGALLVFHHTAVVFNGVYFLFFLLHEMWNPHVDWTVMPTIQLRRTEFVNFLPYSPNDRPGGSPASPPGHIPPQYANDLPDPNSVHQSWNNGDLDDPSMREHLPFSGAMQGGLSGVSPLVPGSTKLDASRTDFPPLWEVNPQTHPRLASHVDALRQQQHQRRNSQPDQDD